MYAFTVLLIYGGFIPPFNPFVYTSAMLSPLVPLLLRIWWTCSASDLMGHSCPLVGASW